MRVEKVKKVPMRKCVITNNQLPKKDLFRVVREPNGVVTIDCVGKVKGHGVYLSKDKEVITLAKKRHSLDRYLETKVEDSIYDELLAILSNTSNEE